MKAALFYAPQDVRIEEIPVPEPGPGEVRVRIKRALTCGTDVKTYYRGHPKLLKNIPSPFGHEFAGVIDAVGPGVMGWAKGDRVVAVNSAPCQNCYYCKVGDYSMCEHLEFLNGAFADYIVVPARIVQQNLYHIPEHLSYEEAAILEPLACAVHGVEKSDIQLGDTVAIIGAGPIGLMFLQLVRLKGGRVIIVDKSKYRLEIARMLGAAETLIATNPDDVVRSVRELTPESRGADVVIEAVGLPSVWEQALQMVRKGGTVNLFGGTREGTSINIDTILLHYSQLTIKGVFHHTPKHVQTAFSLISDRRFRVDPFLSGEYPLERVVEALKLHGQQEGIKFTIVP